ncbi:hypothetical protein EMPS_04860 [Entomortierella parvispora]|uniref:Transcription activator GCR1-like domain-containing protein n=1 Tax=Entomortierella parvispora TaxID=205924 RepID=A0A9P3LVX4_9FUNG|nr:hypothetical protein EMPS_04860 [Entomortierella parvispora]
MKSIKSKAWVDSSESDSDSDHSHGEDSLQEDDYDSELMDSDNEDEYMDNIPDNDNDNSIKFSDINSMSQSELSDAAFPVFDDEDFSRFKADEIYIDHSYFHAKVGKLPVVKQYYPSKNVETVTDVLDEFILGFEGAPAFQELDRKYKQLWRLSHTPTQQMEYIARRDIAERFAKLVLEDGLSNAQAINLMERVQDGQGIVKLKLYLYNIAQCNIAKPAFPGGPSPYSCFKYGEFDPPRTRSETAALRNRPDKHDIPIIRMEEFPKGVRDVLLNWRFGMNGKPAIQDLYRRYDHFWRHKADADLYKLHSTIVNKFLEFVHKKRFTEEAAIRKMERLQKYDSLIVLRKKLQVRNVNEQKKFEREKRKRARALVKKQKEKLKRRFRAENAKRRKRGLPGLKRISDFVRLENEDKENGIKVEEIKEERNIEEEADDNDPESEKSSPYYPYTKFRAEEFKILEDDEVRDKKGWGTPESLVPRLCNEVWTVGDVLQEWRFGLRGGQAIQDLDNQYGRRWRVISEKKKYKCRRAIVQAYVRLVLDYRLSNKKAIMWLEELRETRTLEGLQAALLFTPHPPGLEVQEEEVEEEEEEAEEEEESDTDDSDTDNEDEDESHADAQETTQRTKEQTITIDHSENEDAEASGDEHPTRIRKGSKRTREGSVISAHSDDEEADDSGEEGHGRAIKHLKRTREDSVVDAYQRNFKEDEDDHDTSDPESYAKKDKYQRNIWKDSVEDKRRKDDGKGPLNWPSVPATFHSISGYRFKSITGVPYPVRYLSSFKDVWDEWKVGWKGEPSLEALVRPLGAELVPRLKWDRQTYRMFNRKKLIVAAVEYCVSAGVVDSAEEAINILDAARGNMAPEDFLWKTECREIFARWGVPKTIEMFYYDQTRTRKPKVAHISNTASS